MYKCLDIELILKLIKRILTTKIDQNIIGVKKGVNGHIVYAKKWADRQKLLNKHGIYYVKQLVVYYNEIDGINWNIQDMVCSYQKWKSRLMGNN